MATASLGEAVLKIVADVKGLQAGLGKAQAFLGKMESGLKSVRMAAIKTGLALAAMFAPAILQGAQFEQTMAGVMAVMSELQDGTEIATQKFAALNQKAKELGASTQFSASQVATAMEFLGLAGFTTQQALEGVEATLSLAAAGALDLGRTADIASDSMTAFGLATQDLSRIVDVLALTASSANTTVEMLGEAFKFVAPTAAVLGQDIETISAALGVLANAGIKGSSAGTGLSQILIQLAKKGEDANKVLRKYGLTFQDVNPEVVSLTEIIRKFEIAGISAGDAIKLFGIRAGRAFLAMEKQGATTLEDLTEKLNDASGAADRMAKIRMDTVTGEWLKFKSAVEGLNISIFESFKGELEEVVKWVTEVVSVTRVWVEDNAELVVTVFKLTVVIGVFIGVLTTLITVLGAVKVALITVAAFSGPVGWVVLAISALVAGVVALWMAVSGGDGFGQMAENAERLRNHIAKLDQEVERHTKAVAKQSAQTAKALALLRDWTSLTPLQLQQFAELQEAGALDVRTKDLQIARTEKLLELRQQEIDAAIESGALNQSEFDQLLKKRKAQEESRKQQKQEKDDAEFLQRSRLQGVESFDKEKEAVEKNIETLTRWRDAALTRSELAKKQGKDFEPALRAAEALDERLAIQIARQKELNALDRERIELTARFGGDEAKISAELLRRTKLQKEADEALSDSISREGKLGDLRKELNRKQLTGLAEEKRQIKDASEERQKLFQDEIEGLKLQIQYTSEDMRQKEIRAKNTENELKTSEELNRLQRKRAKLLGQVADLEGLAAKEAERAAKLAIAAEKKRDDARTKFMQEGKVDDLERQERFIEAARERHKLEVEEAKKTAEKLELTEKQKLEHMRRLNATHKDELRDAAKQEADLRNKKDVVKAVEREAKLEDDIFGALAGQIKSAGDLLTVYALMAHVRQVQENRARAAAQQAIAEEERLIRLKERRDDMEAKGKDTTQIDRQIKLAETQLAITQGVAQKRAGEAQLPGVAQQAELAEIDQMKQKLTEVQTNVAELRGGILEEFELIREQFSLAPIVWVDAFVDVWEAEAQRIVDAVRATMAALKPEMDPHTTHSPSLIQIWEANVDVVKHGINRMGQAIQQGAPNLHQLNMGQALASRPAGISPAGMTGGQMRAKEFNDNRRVQMDIHNNVDIENVKRQVGRSLEQVNMGSAEEI